MRVKKQPKSGQYVVTWEYQGKLWCQGVRVIGRKNHIVLDQDSGEDTEQCFQLNDFSDKCTNIRFYIAKVKGCK